jgi:histone-lysine N-methyltransferase SETMAR
MFKHNKPEFLCRYVTMDERWIYHFTPESSRSSSWWTATGELHPKRPKAQQSAGKIMAAVLWDKQGIIFIDYIEKGNTINSEYYIVLLERLKAKIAIKRPHMAKKIILFHQDNAHELKIELLLHPPYSLDLVPSDYWLFANLKKILAGKKFRSNEEVISETEDYFETKDKSF